MEQRQLRNNGEFINVNISLVSSPQCFVITLRDDMAEYEEMLKGLQAFCATANGKISTFSDIHKGECYAVCDDDERKWVR